MRQARAVGEREPSGAEFQHASELFGLVGPQLRTEIPELADRGLVTEDRNKTSIRPDLLAERIFVGCFLDQEWRPALDFDEVYRRFAPDTGTRQCWSV
jgi:hypothetical protein